MFVKICGLRTSADVAVAVESGADAVGFVFTDSPRRVDPAEVHRLVAAVPPEVLTVAVFRDEPSDRIRQDARDAGVRAVQLHGEHQPQHFDGLRDLGLTLVRATSAASAGLAACGDWGEDLLILDSPLPGSGEKWDWSAASGGGPRGRWLLAGGLTPLNVAEAVAAARPWGVDVSSGVEVRRGVKDPALIRDFVNRAKAA